MLETVARRFKQKVAAATGSHIQQGDVQITKQSKRIYRYYAKKISCMKDHGQAISSATISKSYRGRKINSQDASRQRDLLSLLRGLLRFRIHAVNKGLLLSSPSAHEPATPAASCSRPSQAPLIKRKEKGSFPKGHVQVQLEVAPPRFISK